LHKWFLRTLADVAAAPPDDPDAWSEEEWLTWLAEVDAEAAPEPEGRPGRPDRSLGVTLMGAAMLGMQRAIFGDSADPQIVLVVDADGDPPDPERLEIRLDHADPDASSVTVRPWLADDPEPTTAEPTTTGSTTTGPMTTRAHDHRGP